MLLALTISWKLRLMISKLPSAFAQMVRFSVVCVEVSHR